MPTSLSVATFKASKYNADRLKKSGLIISTCKIPISQLKIMINMIVKSVSQQHLNPDLILPAGCI